MNLTSFCCLSQIWALLPGFCTRPTDLCQVLYTLALLFAKDSTPFSFSSWKISWREWQSNWVKDKKEEISVLNTTEQNNKRRVLESRIYVFFLQNQLTCRHCNVVWVKAPNAASREYNVIGNCYFDRVQNIAGAQFPYIFWSCSLYILLP